jgi:hypothetical protein
MADKKTYKTASGAQQYGSTEDFKKQARFLEDPVGNNDDALISSAMDAGDMERWRRKQKLPSIWVI